MRAAAYGLLAAALFLGLAGVGLLISSLMELAS